jgi:hypothetical protein
VTESEPHELVVLVDEEFVGDRGSVKVVWLVEHNDGWVRASTREGAKSQRLDTGPGVVWRSRIELVLVRGAKVERVETRPNARRGTTLDHLTGGGKAKRPGVVRSRFVVGSGGRLTPHTASTRRTK